jgi:hypothetical protein
MSFYELLTAGYPLGEIISCPKNDKTDRCPCNYCAAKNIGLPLDCALKKDPP